MMRMTGALALFLCVFSGFSAQAKFFKGKDSCFIINPNKLLEVTNAISRKGGPLSFEDMRKIGGFEITFDFSELPKPTLRTPFVTVDGYLSGGSKVALGSMDYSDYNDTLHDLAAKSFKEFLADREDGLTAFAVKKSLISVSAYEDIVMNQRARLREAFSKCYERAFKSKSVGGKPESERYVFNHVSRFDMKSFFHGHRMINPFKYTPNLADEESVVEPVPATVPMMPEHEYKEGEASI